MTPQTEREFLREMESLAYRAKAHAETDEEREFYAEVEARWKERREAFERRQKDAA